jgi:hypothetical protein
MDRELFISPMNLGHLRGSLFCQIDPRGDQYLVRVTRRQKINEQLFKKYIGPYRDSGPTPGMRSILAIGFSTHVMLSRCSVAGRH